jgi:hypothetical protein
MSGFPESGRQKSLFDHLAGARPFARRLPRDFGRLEQAFAFGGAGDAARHVLEVDRDLAVAGHATTCEK